MTNPTSTYRKPRLPRPPFDQLGNHRIIASVFLSDTGSPVTAMMLLLANVHPHYRVVEVQWRASSPDRWPTLGSWDVTSEVEFENIVPAVEHYAQNGGDY